MSELGVTVEQSRRSILSTRAAAAVAAVAVAAAAGWYSYDHGYFDTAKSEAPITGPHTLELDNVNPYAKIPVFEGKAIGKNGKIVTISSLQVNPLTRNVTEQKFRIEANTDASIGMVAFADANDGTGVVVDSALDKNPDGSMVGELVYGDPYAKQEDPTNEFGSFTAPDGRKTGLYWAVGASTTDNGVKKDFEAFIPAPLALVDAPVVVDSPTK